MSLKRIDRFGKLVFVAAIGVFTITSGGRLAGQQESVDCSRRSVLCVGGADREFDAIQPAVDRARRGDTVVVFPGDYEGFRVSRSGKPGRPIVIQARDGARIVRRGARDDVGIYLRRVSWVTIQGFEIDARSMEFGLAARDARPGKPMRGLEILDNTVTGADSTDIYLSEVAESLVAGNVAADSVASHGIYLANAGSDDTELRGNECYGNAKNGIHFNGDARVGGDGLHTGLVVDGNVLHDNAANGLDLDGVRDSTFSNNVVYDNGRHGLRGFAIDAAAGPANLVIVNNTFADNRGWAIKLTQDDGGHTIFNNILVSRGGGVAIDSDPVVSDYNVAKRFSLDGEATVIGIAAWRAAGHGTHSFGAARNRLFTRAGRADYTLKSSSPAVDRGTAALARHQAPAVDIAGDPRPQGGGVDLGAYEQASARQSGRLP